MLWMQRRFLDDTHCDRMLISFLVSGRTTFLDFFLPPFYTKVIFEGLKWRALYLCLPLNNPRDLHLHIAYDYDEMYVKNMHRRISRMSFHLGSLASDLLFTSLSRPINTEHSHKNNLPFHLSFFTRHYIKRLFGSSLPIYWLKVWEQPIDDGLNTTCMRRMPAYTRERHLPYQREKTRYKGWDRWR